MRSLRTKSSYQVATDDDHWERSASSSTTSKPLNKQEDVHRDSRSHADCFAKPHPSKATSTHTIARTWVACVGREMQPPTPHLALPLETGNGTTSGSGFPQQQSSQPLCTPVDSFIPRAAPGDPEPPPPPSPSRKLRLRACPGSAGSNAGPSPGLTAMLPDMSQDTLALFPRIVADAATVNAGPPHHGRFGHGAVTGGAPATSKYGLLDAKGQPRPPRCPPSAGPPTSAGSAASTGIATQQLAKASLIAALHAHAPLRNPFVDKKQRPESREVMQRPSRAFFLGAVSESFDAEGLASDRAATDSDPCTRTSSTERGQGGAGQVLALKSSLVAASQPHSSALHFTQSKSTPPIVSNFSTVTRATCRVDGIDYALKRNKQPFANASERLAALQEVFALSALQSLPNVMRYYASWWESGGSHIVIQTEWVDDGCLKARLGPEELSRLGRDMYRLLAQMHAKGIAHLDIKPENIFLAERNGEPAYVLGDFGLARHICPRSGIVEPAHDSEITDGRSFDGDSRYLCPEAILDSDDTRGDGSAQKRKRPETPVFDESLDEEPYVAGGDMYAHQESPPAPKTVRTVKKRRVRPSLAEAWETPDKKDGVVQRQMLSPGTTGAARNLQFSASESLSQAPSQSASQSIWEAGVTPRKASRGPRQDHHRDGDTTPTSEEDDVEGAASPAILHSPPPVLALGASSGDPGRSPRSRPPSRDLRAADVFSLGASLFELARGEVLQSGGQEWARVRSDSNYVFRTMLKHTKSQLLAQVVEKCLAKRPEDRPSASEAAELLDQTADHKAALRRVVAENESLRKNNAALVEALEALTSGHANRTAKSVSGGPGTAGLSSRTELWPSVSSRPNQRTL